jgi:hypothetical protein
MKGYQVPASSRMLKDGLQALALVAKNPLVVSTFMGISPGGLMNPGYEDRAEKSELFVHTGNYIAHCGVRESGGTGSNFLFPSTECYSYLTVANVL